MRASMRGSMRRVMVVDSDWSAPMTERSMSFGSSRCSSQNLASSCSQVNGGISSHSVTRSILLSTPFRHVGQASRLSVWPLARHLDQQARRLFNFPYEVHSETFLS